MQKVQRNIEQRCIDIVAEQLGVSKAEVKPESSFVQDLGADSLDVVELTMAVEDEFDIAIADEDAEKFTTVQTVVDYVKTVVKTEDTELAAIVESRRGEEAVAVDLKDL